MVRITNSVASHRRKKRLFKRAKGFVGDRKNHLRLTSGAVVTAMAYNYAHRKQRKRDFRSLWITRISAAAKMHGISYSQFIHGLKRAKCELDRKLLAELAVNDPSGFAAVVGQVKRVFA